jgi:predicted amidohydrolase YtcJ
MKKISAALLLISIVISSCTSPQKEFATLVISNARIWTGDPEQPWAEAVASRGEKIIAVGAVASMEPLISETTKVIAIDGSMLVPGFIDTHVHFLSGSSGLASVQLRDAKTPENFSKRIAEFAKTIEPGEWILNGAWDHTNWGGQLPSREWIDAVTPDNPVWVSRLDGHMGLANSRALDLAGIDADSPDIDGGTIVRDESGKPSGILKDNAMRSVFAVLPELTEAQLDRYLDAGMQYVASNGVTTLHDVFADEFDSWASLATFRRADSKGALITRI